MKNSILLLLLLCIGGFLNLYGQCTNEKGYNDFPFTQNGLTVSASGTGGYTIYAGSYTSCGITTKSNEVYIGQTASTFTNTFSTAVNDMVYNMTAAGEGEVVTITVSSGTPTVTYIAGDCPEAMIISGNVITMAPGTNNHGGRVKVHSTSNFTSVTFSHNGAASGCLMTMCFDAVFASVQPTVTTTAITAITGSSASSGGNVTADGGSSVTAYGVCWNTSETPISTGNHTSDGSGTGSFSSSIAGLATGTTYYARAYATNTNGTAYGSELSFTTSSSPAPANPTSASATAPTICNGYRTTLTANGAVGTVYWYTGSCGGTQVATGNPITVSPTTSTTYYARNYNNAQYSAGCASVDVTVNQPSFNPTFTVASLQASGTGIKWYTAGGTELVSTDAIITGTTYYASQTVNGVESTNRLAVTATLVSTPCAPTASSPQTPGAGAKVSALTKLTGENIRWYTDSSGGVYLDPATNLLSGTNTYYASQTVNCKESATRVAVTVTLP